MKKVKKPPKITQQRYAGLHEDGNEYAVVSLQGGEGAGHRRKVCEQCPWRKDNVGNFPAEAFRHSANTSYDMSQNTFACHMHPKEAPSLCAGFLLRGADHNLAIRLKRSRGECMDVQEPSVELFDGYKDMAVANGCDPDEEVLKPCR
jgi:hypothetical protein